jgi:hypothetical protein
MEEKIVCLKSSTNTRGMTTFRRRLNLGFPEVYATEAFPKSLNAIDSQLDRKRGLV